MSSEGSGTDERRLAPSRFEEDAVPPGHRAVWGSWYCVATQRWGFKCCRATSRDAAPCRLDLSTSASEAEAGGSRPAQAPAPAAAEWRPREAFGTAEGFVAHAVRHFASRWAQWLRGGTLARCAHLMSPATASVLLSEKSAREAASCIEDFCGRLYQQLLAADLVGKLEAICNSIHEREYAQANKLYVDLTIGSKKWLNDLPVFVHFDMKRQDTDVKWTPDSGKNAIDDAGLRGHVVVLRRLLAVAQTALPNEDPSKNCG